MWKYIQYLQLFTSTGLFDMFCLQNEFFKVLTLFGFFLSKKYIFEDYKYHICRSTTPVIAVINTLWFENINRLKYRSTFCSWQYFYYIPTNGSVVCPQEHCLLQQRIIVTACEKINTHPGTNLIPMLIKYSPRNARCVHLSTNCFYYFALFFSGWQELYLTSLCTLK